MNRQLWIGVLLVIVGFVALQRVNAKPGEAPDAPRFNQKGELLPPEDYRDWVYLTTGLDMSYSDQGGMKAGPAAATGEPLPFDNVFVKPESYREFQRTGAWPDKTMLVIEVRMSKTKVHPNQHGYVQSDRVALEAAVKDVKRFGEKKWAYFSLLENRKPAPAEAMPPSHCWDCHNANGAVDNTFVQFYPTLKPIAEAKGTYKKTGPGQ